MVIPCLNLKMLVALILTGSLLFQYAFGIPLREMYPVGDAEEDSISNIELLLPVMVKGHGSQDKRDIHYPNVNVKDFDFGFHMHNPSDYITNNFGLMHDSAEIKPVFIRNDNEKLRSVKKDLKNNNFENNIVLNLLKDVKTPKPKPVPLELYHVCKRFLDYAAHKSTVIMSDIKIELVVHYCKELLDTLNDKDETDKHEHDEEDSEEHHLPDIKSKYYSIEDDSNNGECTCCSQYVLNGLKHWEVDDHLNHFDERAPPMNLISSAAPAGWFGPYNGRRDWTVLNEEYPGMMRSYLNKYKKLDID